MALKDWEDIKRFEKDAVDAQHLDVVYVLRRMMAQKAFYFTAMPTLVMVFKAAYITIGRNLFNPTEGELVHLHTFTCMSDTATDTLSILPVHFRIFGLECILLTRNWSN